MIDVLEDRNKSTTRRSKELVGVGRVIGDKFCPRIVQFVRAKTKQNKKRGVSIHAEDKRKRLSPLPVFRTL